jgi:hypothetical protein
VRYADRGFRVQTRALLEPERSDAVPRQSGWSRRRRRARQHEAQRELPVRQLPLHPHQERLQLRSLLPQDQHLQHQRVPHASRQRLHGLVLQGLCPQSGPGQQTRRAPRRTQGDLEEGRGRDNRQLLRRPEGRRRPEVTISRSCGRNLFYLLRHSFNRDNGSLLFSTFALKLTTNYTHIHKHINTYRQTTIKTFIILAMLIYRTNN